MPSIKDNCLIIAHRGESYDAPENTLAAINLAWQKKAHAVEIDIQLTKDNKIVVIHDTNTKRTGGRNKNVKAQTLSELKELDFGIYKGIEWKGEKIPTLREVLETVPIGKKLIIEIKCGAEIIELLHKDIKDSHLPSDQIEIIGFVLWTVSLVKNTLPEHKALLLSELDHNWLRKIFPPSVEKLIDDAVSSHLDGLDFRASKMIDQQLIEKVKSKGLKLYIWTVNDPIEAKRLIELGVDGITTDRASWMKEQLSQIK